MAKKLVLIGMVVAAVAAFVVPAAASASPVLTSSDNPGVPIATESVIMGASSNAVTENTALGTLRCEEVTVNAEVTENSGSSIAAEGLSGATKNCEAEGLPLTVTNPELVTLTTSGSSHTGNVSLAFTADVGPFSCPFSGSGAFHYETGVDLIHITGVTLHGPAFCEPEEGSPVFSATFTLTTENGASVYVS